MSELVAVFVSRLADPACATATTSELAAELAALIARARVEAPGVDLDPLAFVAYVADRVAFEGDACASFARLRAGALWIAYGCVTGNAAALAAFETEYAKEIAAALRRSFDPTVCEDAELALRNRLFLVGDDDVPRLASYSGRGDLRAWLRAAAVRTAIDLLRSRRLVPVEHGALDASVIDDDPLLAMLEPRYRDELRIAFAAAASTLTDRERTLLRYRFFDDLSIDEIGRLYRVHRATVARWIAVIRERLFEETRARLMAHLGLDDSAEADSILRLIDSHLDLSVETLLGS